MYEDYSKQALPSRRYRELLGTAICVFNANNSFVIENILRNDIQEMYSWHELIDLESGELLKPIKETITKVSNTNIARKFEEIVVVRNRIIHSFQITDIDGEQRMATKAKNGEQWIITEKYLMDFIDKNSELSTMLHEFRGF